MVQSRRPGVSQLRFQLDTIMASKEPSGPGGGLVYEAKLHLRWRPADTDYSVSDMRAANAFTLQLLKTGPVAWTS